MKSSELPDVSSDVKEVAEMSDANRIAHLGRERWIRYDGASTILDRLRTVMTSPKRLRKPNALIIGPTNNGKTMILEAFCRENAGTPKPAAEHFPVLQVQTPTRASVTKFYQLMLDRLGTPSSATRGRPAELEVMSIRLLRSVGTKVIAIDDIHNILTGTRDQQSEFLNLLRFLGNQAEVSIVAAGIETAYRAIRSDNQLENRFYPLVLPRWRLGPEFHRLVLSLFLCLPLRKESEINAALLKLLIERSDGTIGELSALIASAASLAISSGQERIDEGVIRNCTYKSPIERRRDFESIERAIR